MRDVAVPHPRVSGADMEQAETILRLIRQRNTVYVQASLLITAPIRRKSSERLPAQEEDQPRVSSFLKITTSKLRRAHRFL